MVDDLVGMDAVFHALAHQARRETLRRLDRGCLITLIAWFAVARATVRRRGADVRSAFRHWSVTAWRLAIIGSVVLAVLGLKPVDARSRDALRESLLALDRFQVLVVAVRIVAVGVLLVAMWFVSGRVRTLLANAPVVPVGVPGPPSGGRPLRGPVAAYRRWRDRRQTRVYD